MCVCVCLCLCLCVLAGVRGIGRAVLRVQEPQAATARMVHHTIQGIDEPGTEHRMWPRSHGCVDV